MFFSCFYNNLWQPCGLLYSNMLILHAYKWLDRAWQRMAEDVVFPTVTATQKQIGYKGQFWNIKPKPCISKKGRGQNVFVVVLLH